MSKIALIYGSDTGMTEEVVSFIVDNWTLTELEIIDVSNVTKADFERFNHIIIGLSTWYDGDLQSDWEIYFDEEFQEIDFTGKTVALFGLGDQYGYAEYFIDGVGILAKVILKNGGTIIGKWPIKEYDFTESKAEIKEEELFYGLAIDEDNEPELTAKRIKNWLSILKEEFLLLNRRGV